MNSTSLSEADFVNALQNHQPADFARLYAAYAPALYGVLLRLVNDPMQADDLLQDAFIKIWLNSHQYDPQQGRLFTWLLAITRHVALDELRARKVQQKALTSWSDQFEPATPPRVGEGLVDGSLTRSLAPPYRRVVELMYDQGLTSQEAAIKLKLPLGTVKTRVRSALQQLRVQFRMDIQQYQYQASSTPLGRVVKV